MARRRKGRSIDGILLLDKPLGISSNDAVQKVKRAFFAAKAGHTGALDPLATGMLPVCLGEATKFSQFLLDADKTYEVTAKLGIRTTTSDADGEVVQRRQVHVSEKELLDACETFKGPIKQIPSMYSALKHEGKPLYYYARQGIDIPREARDITIFKLEVNRFKDDEVDMTVHCSKGTYIRSLVDDLGQLLGCGAYVTLLHRTNVSDYPSNKMVTLETLDNMIEKARQDLVEPKELLDRLLLPMDTAVKSLVEVKVNEDRELYFGNGNPVESEDASGLEAGAHVRVYSVKSGLFLGAAEIDTDGRVAPKRLVVRNTDDNHDA